MSRRLAAALACVALAFAAAFPPVASAQEERVYDQRNHRENILTAIQTWIAILQRIVQIANQVQDLLALEDPAFREIQDLLAELAQILRATEGLVYPLEDLDPRFRDLFPGFEPADDLPESYAESVRVTLATLRAVLLSTRRNARHLEEGQATLGTLRDQLLETEGNLEAIHAQGILVGFLSEEVSKTTQQLAALTNLLAVEAAHRVQMEAEGIATFEGTLRDANGPPPPYGTRPIHPLVPGSLGF
jgi:P-type conjugative transfer protein TrbJ